MDEVATIAGAGSTDAVFLVVLAVVALVGNGAWAVMRIRDQRARARLVAAWAARRGWRHLGKDERFRHVLATDPVGTSLGCWMRHLVIGPHGAAYVGVAFQLTYYDVSRRWSPVRTFTIVALQLPAALPAVVLERENLRSRSEAVFGGQDIDLESDEFNRAYRIRAADPRFASDMLHPRAMELLGRAAHPPLQLVGRYLSTYGEMPFDPRSIDPTLALLAAVADGVPSFVWTDRGATPPTASEGHDATRRTDAADDGDSTGVSS